MTASLSGLPPEIILCTLNEVDNPLPLRRVCKRMRELTDRWLSKLNEECEDVVNPPYYASKYPIPVAHKTKLFGIEMQSKCKVEKSNPFTWLTSQYPVRFPQLKDQVNKKAIVQSLITFVDSIARSNYLPLNEDSYLPHWHKFIASSNVIIVYSVFISDHTITHFPTLLKDLSCLKNLTISDYQLRQVEVDVIDLPQVEILILNKQNLDTLQRVCRFPRLKELRLNECTGALHSDWYPHGLKELHIFKHTSDLPCVPKMTELVTVQLTQCRLKEVPEFIFSARSLKILNLSENAIENIPGSIQQCAKLEFLNFTANRLSKIPDAVFRLTHLLHLNLNRNQIVQLPDNTSAIESLEVLEVEDNKLTALPKGLMDVETLERIDCAMNYIFKLPLELHRRVAEESLTVNGLHMQK